MNAIDWVTAIGTAITGLATVALVITAIVAWRTARGSLEAARASNEQARLDSIAQTRPYVYVEIVPGLWGPGSFDLRVVNTGKTSARRLHLETQEWPDPPDDIVQAAMVLFGTERTLPPGCSIRTAWRMTAGPGQFFDDGTTETGMPDTDATVKAMYAGDDPALAYSDEFSLLLQKSGMRPTPEAGPDHPANMNSDSRAFYRLGQVLVRRIGELSR